MTPSIPRLDQALLTVIRGRARAQRLPVYIVGGYLRDLFLSTPKANPDIDFAVEKGAVAFGRKVAQAMRAGFVVLDAANGSCRVVKKHLGRTFTFDFTDFRGPALAQDLVLRDFTINTFALDLEAALSGGSVAAGVIDMYGGARDLKAKVLRAPSAGVFEDDPLRVLRAFSFSARLGFSIEKKTLTLARRSREGLLRVSPERVRDELFKIFSSGRAYEALDHLDQCGVLKIIFPEIEPMRGVSQGPYHHLDILRHSLESVRQFEMLAARRVKDPDLGPYLAHPMCGERERRAVIVLACFLHDIGKPVARRRREGKLTFYGHERVGAAIATGICKRLKLSNDEILAVKRLVFCHLRPGYLGDQKKVTPKAAFRYFRDTGEEAVATLLLSLADQRSTKGPLTTRTSSLQHEKICAGLIKEYFRKQKEPAPRKLVNGDDIMKKFRLQPSPLIGTILSRLHELQALGKISTRAEALAAAKKLVKK